MSNTRKSVIDLVLAKLPQIRVVNGYSSDIGQHVEYAEGAQSEPTQDCVAVIDLREVFGNETRRGVRARALELNICAAFVDDEPKKRAALAVEDVLKWLDANPSLGTSGIRVELLAVSTVTDDLGELAELVCELKINY